MNSPYMGKFRVSQPYKGASHDGLDLVGIDSKEIHSTVNGTVIFAGWENPANHAQGFGQYVKIQKTGTNDVYYFGHLSEIRAKTGDHVRITDVIGAEGSTGKSTGSHCHYCMRVGGVKGQQRDISQISGIPNKCGAYDDGYRSATKPQSASENKACPYATPSAIVRYGTRGDAVRWVQFQLNSAGYDCGAVDGIAGAKTCTAIRTYQRDHGLDADGVVGTKTRAAMLG